MNLIDHDRPCRMLDRLLR